MKNKTACLIETNETVTIKESAYIYHLDMKMYLVRDKNDKEQIVLESQLKDIK